MNDVATLSETPVPPAESALKNWMPFVVGMAYGLVMRLVFWGDGHVASNHIFQTMSLSFVVLVPIGIGAITVYLAEKKCRRSIWFYFLGPWVSVGLFLLGTMLLLIEGSICIAMAAPLFLLLGSVGGIVMGVFCRLHRRPIRTLQGVVALPLLFAALDIGHVQPDHHGRVIRSVYIAATPDVIWQHVNFPINIDPAELKGGIAYRIGVPFPIEGRTLSEGIGGTRHLIWQRGVAFNELITDWDLHRRISWRYQFDEKSFPPGSLDDHVMIGGRHFNLEDTTYTLTPEGSGTRLSVSVGYRVTTEFNWYATAWADYLIRDTADTILGFYKVRSERTVAAGSKRRSPDSKLRQFGAIPARGGSAFGYCGGRVDSVRDMNGLVMVGLGIHPDV